MSLGTDFGDSGAVSVECDWCWKIRATSEILGLSISRNLLVYIYIYIYFSDFVAASFVDSVCGSLGSL